MVSQDVVQRAKMNLITEENHTRAINNQHRIASNDFVINSGEDVVGVCNTNQCSFGYKDSRFTIHSNGYQHVKAEDVILELQNLKINTSFDGLSWNGKTLNPTLLGKNLAYLSEKAINNLLNINNSSKDVEPLTKDDIHQVEIFGSDVELMNKIDRNYPIVKVTGWKYEPIKSSLSRRG